MRHEELINFEKNPEVIAIDRVLVSDALVQKQFVCDLIKCKGGCCEDGDAGAPLEKEELDRLNDIYEEVAPYLSPEGRAVIERQGRYVYDVSFGWVTPTVDDGICAYGYRDRKGVIKCAIEQAYLDGKTDWKKPISCHLFPAKTKKTKDYELLNYEPRQDLCSPACALGKKLKVPAYVFLKESIIRKFGASFYEALEQAASHLAEKEKQ